MRITGDECLCKPRRRPETGDGAGDVVIAGDGTAHSQITAQRLLAGVVEIDDAHLVALAVDAQSVVLNVIQIDADEL